MARRPRTTGYTPEDLREFEAILALSESRSQMDRIRGRLRWREFETRFERETLDDMAEEVGAWRSPR